MPRVTRDNLAAVREFAAYKEGAGAGSPGPGKGARC